MTFFFDVFDIFLKSGDRETPDLNFRRDLFFGKFVKKLGKGYRRTFGFLRKQLIKYSHQQLV